MAPTGKRLSQPLYEGLPWLYAAGGLIALIGSYISPYRALSVPMGTLGLLAVIGGIVLLLRRRDYRRMRAQYANSDASLSDLSQQD
jgi:nitrate reductase gamma subunit